jgi:osmoprotectant transport system substrate-binding protein
MRRRRIVDFAAGIILCLSLVFATTCPTAAQDAVRVASKIDTEGALLGNMIIQLLEAGGIKTVNKLRLGPTNIIRSAIIAGEIDIYPEYTGNGALFYSSGADPVWKSAAAGYDKIKLLDRTRHNLVWLPPARANNSWVIAVRQDLASANHLATMEDFARWVRDGGDLKLAASAEFVESPAALPAFEGAYGFKPRQAQLVVLAGGDTAVTIRAAAQRTSGVNAAMAYGTDGALAALGLVVMTDSKSAQVVYAPAPVVRGAVLDKFPAIADRLAPVFRALDETVLRDLNAKIAVDGEEAGQVAANYLRAKGFLN